MMDVWISVVGVLQSSTAPLHASRRRYRCQRQDGHTVQLAGIHPRCELWECEVDHIVVYNNQHCLSA